MLRYIFFLFLLGGLAACSSTDTETKSSASNKDDPGSFFTGKSESGITLGDLTRTSKIFKDVYTYNKNLSFFYIYIKHINKLLI